MRLAQTRSPFWRGFIDCSPFIFVVAPFGFLFGVVAAEAGLNVLESMSMAVLIIAGAAQFTALTLMQKEAPTIVVIITALAINLRMAMYSAALVPHLGKVSLAKRALAAYFIVDQSFAVSIRKYQSERTMSPEQKLAYFFGCAISICPAWYLASLLGALIGRSIPAEYSLDFAIPICFISIIAPMLRSLPNLVCATVSVVFAILLAWMPYNLWLLASALLAMIAGAQTELWMKAAKTNV